MSEFKREDRYIVIKRSHLARDVLNYLECSFSARGIPQLQNAAVIESDWPEYEPVWAMIEARMTGAPVPPAGGEVEVLAWMYRREGGEILGRLVALESEDLKYVREGKRFEGRTLLFPRSDYFDWIPLVDLAHVTRLQAENATLRHGLKGDYDLDAWLDWCGKRDRLLAEREALQQRLTIADQRVDDLQSELTKARELLAEASAWIKSNSCHGTDAIDLWERLDSAHQSAPAACWTPENHECPGDGIGACKKCPNAPAAKCETCEGTGHDLDGGTNPMGGAADCLDCGGRGTAAKGVCDE